jgi:hypothetical protein
MPNKKVKKGGFENQVDKKIVIIYNNCIKDIKAIEAITNLANPTPDTVLDDAYSKYNIKNIEITNGDDLVYYLNNILIYNDINAIKNLANPTPEEHTVLNNIYYKYTKGIKITDKKELVNHILTNLSKDNSESQLNFKNTYKTLLKTHKIKEEHIIMDFFFYELYNFRNAFSIEILILLRNLTKIYAFASTIISKRLQFDRKSLESVKYRMNATYDLDTNEIFIEKEWRQPIAKTGKTIAHILVTFFRPKNKVISILDSTHFEIVNAKNIALLNSIIQNHVSSRTGGKAKKK